MKQEEKLTIFDKTQVFEENCAEMLKKLVAVCEMHRIPFFFSACIKNDEDGTKYKNDGNMTGSSGIVLKDDQINRHMLVAAGFGVVQNPYDMEIMMDDPDML